MKTRGDAMPNIAGTLQSGADSTGEFKSGVFNTNSVRLLIA
jgi:hypothetical protein